MTSEAWIALASLAVIVLGGLWTWSNSFEKKIVQLFDKHDGIAKEVKDNKAALAKDLEDNKAALEAHQVEFEETKRDVAELNISHVKMEKDIDTLKSQYQEIKSSLDAIKLSTASTATSIALIQQDLRNVNTEIQNFKK